MSDIRHTYTDRAHAFLHASTLKPSPLKRGTPTMPKWTDRPPENTAGPAFPILRTPPSGFLEAISTASNLLGCPTHFWGGRTYPCLGDDCPACQQANPWRWHGYISAKAINTGLHFLYEFTAAAAESFIEYRASWGTLRGCHFRARRHNSAKNGQVLLALKPMEIDPRFLPTEPDLYLILCKLWNLPVELHHPGFAGRPHLADPAPTTPTKKGEPETINQILDECPHANL